jgi:thiamine biosynthesis lipoprotein
MEPKKVTLSFEAIGTTWTIELEPDVRQSEHRELEHLIRGRIDEFDQTYSRFRPDSLVRRISRTAGRYTFPPDADGLFSLYRKLYELSHGAVTPLIGGLMEDAGYDASYSLVERPLRPVPDWDEVMTFHAGSLDTRRPVLLDVGAIGKGYLIDCLQQLIMQYGITSFFINAGGDILNRTVSEFPLTVALEDPFNRDEAIGIAAIYNKSICGSAGSRRAWGRFNHIIDPRTSSSPTHLAAVWVVADDTQTADALTTALYFVRPEQLGEHFSFEYALMRPDRSLEYSPAFPAEFFS